MGSSGLFSLRGIKHRTRVLGRAFRMAGGVFERQCSICGFEGKFLLAGQNLRPDAMCPRCAGLERHRLFGLWLSSNKHSFSNRAILHFAPEEIIRSLVAPLCGDYKCADIVAGRADLVLNAEDIDLPESSVDDVICFHVLEHVDHLKVLQEFHRILREGGRAILSFPIIEGWDDTYDIGPLSSDRERQLHYGQWDHIKYFGRSVRKDIEGAGFALEEFTAVEPFVHRHALVRGQKLFIAVKRLSST